MLYILAINVIYIHHPDIETYIIHRHLVHHVAMFTKTVKLV